MKEEGRGGPRGGGGGEGGGGRRRGGGKEGEMREMEEGKWDGRTWTTHGPPSPCKSLLPSPPSYIPSSPVLHLYIPTGQRRTAYINSES